MPRVSLVGNGHGGSEDYATISLWAAAEFSVDYGSRLEAQCLGDCGSSQTVSGTTVNGLVPLVYTLGVVYDFTAATQSQLATIRTFNHRTPLEIKNFSFTAVSDFFNCYVPNGSSDGSTLENIFSEHPTASGVDCFSISGNVPNSTCTGLVTDGGVRGIDYGFNFVFNVTNFVVLNAQDDGIEGSGSNGTVTDGYSGDNTNSDYSGTFTKVNCASSDSTGSAGLINLASTELVDPGNGDYRTKSTSVLATAGTGGSFIGVALESSGGITLTPNAINSSSSSLNPSIEYASLLQLTPSTINSSSISLDPVIEFNSLLTLSPNTVNSDSVSLNPTILFSGALELSPSVINSSSVGLNPDIQFSSSLNLSPSTINSISVALNPIIEYTSALVLSPQTINSASVSIDPLIEFKSVINLTPGVINSLSVALPPNITTGEVQKIGTVTAGFADDLYSVKYKLSGITVNFKE